MKVQAIGAFTSILVLVMLLSSSKSTEAQYYGHDGSVDENLEKITVKPYPGKKDYWTYIVKACASSHSLGIAEVILKSDIDQQILGVNKAIPKGTCSYYGAVMKAKDGKTLGAELVETQEAVDKMMQILKDKSSASKIEKKNMMKEFYRIYTTIGLMPRTIPT